MKDPHVSGKSLQAGGGKTPNLKGRLSTMSLPDIIQWIQFGHKKGTLLIETDDVRKQIYFERGNVIFASSSKPHERLGQFLLRAKNITQADLQRCLDIWASEQGKRKLSEIFVDSGLITEAGMLARLRQLVQEIVFDLFLYDDGHFEFCEGYVPPYVLCSFYLDSQNLLMEGLYRVDEYRRNVGRLPSANQVLVHTGANLARLMEMSAEAQYLYAMVDGRKDLQELLDSSPLSAYEAQVHLLTLLQENLVAVKAMDVGEVLERRLAHILERGEAYLAEGNLDKAAWALREGKEVIYGNTKLRSYIEKLETLVTGYERRLQKFMMEEVSRLSGGPDVPMRVAYEALNSHLNENLTTEQGFILSRIGDYATLREILLTSGLPREKTYELMFSLLSLGLVKRAR
ncbi:MAG: DUF4388 domain-containing protein [Candidatus Schekmanbacteria bacterium]|nr:DUF4388 domain-containing protein [Candidatus Schekmanbacteria bacterium]